MTEADWGIVLEVFDAAQSARGEPDRKFPEALHHFTLLGRAPELPRHG